MHKFFLNFIFPLITKIKIYIHTKWVHKKYTKSIQKNTQKIYKLICKQVHKECKQKEI